MSNSLKEEDLAPDAGVQYVALYLLEKARNKGLIYGHFPRGHLLDKSERQLLKEILENRSGLHGYSDVQVAGAIRWAIATFVSQGFNFECDINKMMKWYQGRE